MVYRKGSAIANLDLKQLFRGIRIEVNSESVYNLGNLHFKIFVKTFRQEKRIYQG